MGGRVHRGVSGGGGESCVRERRGRVYPVVPNKTLPMGKNIQDAFFEENQMRKTHAALHTHSRLVEIQLNVARTASSVVVGYLTWESL